MSITSYKKMVYDNQSGKWVLQPVWPGSPRLEEENPPRSRRRNPWKLAQLPGEAILDKAALANSIGCSKRTISRMVDRMELPKPIRLGGRASWVVKRIRAWFEKNSERSEQETTLTYQRFRKNLGPILEKGR